MRIDRMNASRRQNNLKTAFVVVLIIVLLSSCLCVGSLLAWLTQDIDRESTDTLTIGQVDFDIYSGNTKISSTKSNSNGVSTSETTQEVSVTGNSTIRSVNLSIRNTGTVDAIIRVTLSVYRKDTDGKKIALHLVDSPSSNTEIDIQNDGWVNDFKDDVTSGYVYYNNIISPYTIKRVTHSSGGTDTITTQDVTANAVSVMSQILVPESMKTETYYISVTVEGVAYKGNIYQELDENSAVFVEAYPFGTPESLPTGWTAWKYPLPTT